MNVITLLRISVRVQGRWAVGGVDLATDEIDLPVLHDPRVSGDLGYRPWVPATGLAGSLRRALGNRAEPLLGPEPARFEEMTGDVDRVASPLALIGVTVDPGSHVTTHGATAIDAFRGAAKGRSLRTHQSVSPNGSATHTTLTLAVEYSGELVDDDLQLLADWQPTIGRGASVGMGQGAVHRIEVVVVDLDRPEHLFWWLSGRHEWFVSGLGAPADAIRSPFEPSASSQPEHALTYRLAVREPIHVGSGDRSDGEQRGQVLLVLRSGDNALIPGSSWKGVFRHRIRHILAALDSESDTLIAVEEVLFGSQKRRGSLIFHDTMLRNPQLVTRTHVAIDRFTGGAREGALYTVQAINRDTAVGLTIASRDKSIPEHTRNLLNHVIRDLFDGLIGIGGMGTRGYGWLRRAKKDKQYHIPEAIDMPALLEELLPSASAVEEGAQG